MSFLSPLSSLPRYKTLTPLFKKKWFHQGYGQQSGLDDIGQPLWDGIQVALAEDEESIEVARAPRNELLDGLREPPKDL